MLESSLWPGRSRSLRTQGALVLVLLLAFGLRVCRLGAQSLWWDEMHTGTMARISLRAALDNLLAIRNHVPLYFLLMRVWVWIGTAEFALRFFSLLWGLVAVALIYRLVKEIDGDSAGLIAGLLLAISPFHVWYSQEARMYAQMSTSALAASWFLMRLLKRDRRAYWVGYGACMLVAVYTHYLAVFILAVHYALFSLHYRLLRPLWRKWLVCVGLVMALFGIWMAVILSSGGFVGSPIAWIAAAHGYEPALTLLTFSVGPTVDLRQPLAYASFAASMGALGLVVFGLVRARLPASGTVDMGDPASWEQARRLLYPRFLLIWLAVPLLLIWLISLDLPIPNKRSIYVDRYLITALPAFVAMVAAGLSALCRRWRAVAVAALAIVVASDALALRNMYANPAYAREDWRAAMDYLRDNRQPDEVMLLRPSQTLPLAYYGDPSAPYEELPFLFEEGEQRAFLDGEMPGRMAAIAQVWDRAWLITSVDNTNPHGFPQQRNDALARAHETDAVKGWLDVRYRVLADVRFTGIWLTLYDLR